MHYDLTYDLTYHIALEIGAAYVKEDARWWNGTGFVKLHHTFGARDANEDDTPPASQVILITHGKILALGQCDEQGRLSAYDEVTGACSLNESVLAGSPTGEMGRADLVGLWAPTEGHLYEIKNRQMLSWAIAEVSWYIAANGAVRQQVAGWPHLIPGTLYTWAPGEETIGTNPYYAGQWIVANMQVPGVISWWGRQKLEPEPLPRYVWEWDPTKQKAEKREPNPVPACAVCSDPEPAQLIGERAGETVRIGGVAYIIYRVAKAAVGWLLGGLPGAVLMGVTP